MTFINDNIDTVIERMMAGETPKVGESQCSLLRERLIEKGFMDSKRLSHGQIVHVASNRLAFKTFIVVSDDGRNYDERQWRPGFTHTYIIRYWTKRD